MIPIIGVTGHSQTGKTTIAVKITAELIKRGYQVAAIKHTKRQLETDPPGKDSRQYYDAGANAVALASDGKITLNMPVDQKMPPAEILAKLLPRVDLVLVEGFTDEPMPRIGLVRAGVAENLKTEKGLIAVVTDFDLKTKAPTFNHDQISELADLFETYIKRHRHKRDLKLYVNEKPIFIKPFVKDFILKPIAGMISALRDTQNPKSIRIIIDMPDGSDPED